MTEKTILFIDDDDVLRGIVTHHLHEAGYRVIPESRGTAGLRHLQNTSIDLVVVDLQMPGIDGYQVISQARSVSQEIPIIVITAHGSIESAVQAMKLGAEDYLTKPFNKDALLHSIRKTLEHQELLSENRYLRKFIGEYFALDNIIGTSRRMRDIYDLVEKVAPTSATILINGESGTGKELLAKAIHQHSSRVDQPFLTVNCAAIPEGLLESELFGHKKGSFTSAHSDTTGKFEVANRGTVFLDEIGELPIAMQAKLLRVLQDGEFSRIGESTPRHVDVRFIAATNRDLTRMTEEKHFREDLYFRLNVVPIRVPPLRERADDIPQLAEHFLKDAANKYGRPQIRMDEKALKQIQKYSWPGNIRELKNTIERMVLLSNGDHVGMEDIPEEIRFAEETIGNVLFKLPESGIDLESIESEIVRQALERNGWNQTATSKFLNITRSMLISRMQKYGLSPTREKDSIEAATKEQVSGS